MNAAQEQLKNQFRKSPNTMAELDDNMYKAAFGEDLDNKNVDAFCKEHGLRFKPYITDKGMTAKIWDPRYH